MRGYITTIITAVLFSSCVSCGGGRANQGADGVDGALPSTEIPQKAQKIVISDTTTAQIGADTIRFGRLNSGEIAQKVVWVENQTQKPLVVLGYSVDCACTTIEHSTKPINPTYATPLKVTFNTRGQRGWLVKRIDVTHSGSKRPLQLFVECEVE